VVSFEGVEDGRRRSRTVEDGNAVSSSLARPRPSSTQLFLARLDHDQLVLSADSSGALLHQRGYRLETARAPLRETLAAALLLGAGWDGSTALLDPFCGSGTIPIEAALLALGMPPGWRRAFAFEHWPGFDSAEWARVRRAAEAGIREKAPASIVGSDRDAGAVAAAVANAERAGVAHAVEFRQAALSRVTPSPGGGWLITNPPYGVRIGSPDRLRDLYARLGQVVRRTPGWSAGLLVSDRRLAGHVGLPLKEVWASRNGGIPVRFLVTQEGVSG
jgi:putative N6-adenine-specific DNA methylase